MVRLECGRDPSSGHKLIVTKGTGFLARRSKYCASEDRRDELCVTREAVRDEFSNIHGDQRDALSKIREVREDGFDQKPKEKTDEVTSSNRSKRGQEVEEVNACDVVQEIVVSTVDSGAVKSVWSKGVAKTQVTKTVRLPAASDSPTRVKGDARLDFIRDGKKCNTNFLDADVKRPLASVSAIVNEGNIVVFGPQESCHRE